MSLSQDECKTVKTITLGCRLNAYESDVMEAHARAAGVDNLVIVNTCAVTGEAVRQGRQAIRKARRDNPETRLVVTGCAAKITPEIFANMDEVDAVLDNLEKLSPEAFQSLNLSPSAAKDAVSSPQQKTPDRHTSSPVFTPQLRRARAYVRVQTGCDHSCTFCIIPQGRGVSQSVPVDVITKEVLKLHQNGHQEIVLTGVDLSAWGQDLPGQPVLGDLVARLLKTVPDLPRLRLSSLDAAEIDEHLFRLFAEEERLVPYLHLSLQAGDDLILKRMKRRHLRRHALALCTRLRSVRPDIKFGADFIAGFPTETEEHFTNTLDLVEACDLTYLHVFPFSPRPGTPAARMPQLDRTTIKQRAQRLRDKADDMLNRHLAEQKGTLRSVLVEKPGSAARPGFGRAADFSPCRLRESTPEAGTLMRFYVTGHAQGALEGRQVV